MRNYVLFAALKTAWGEYCCTWRYGRGQHVVGLCSLPTCKERTVHAWPMLMSLFRGFTTVSIVSSLVKRPWLFYSFFVGIIKARERFTREIWNKSLQNLFFTQNNNMFSAYDFRISFCSHFLHKRTYLLDHCLCVNPNYDWAMILKINCDILTRATCSFFVECIIQNRCQIVATRIIAESYLRYAYYADIIARSATLRAECMMWTVSQNRNVNLLQIHLENVPNVPLGIRYAYMEVFSFFAAQNFHISNALLQVRLWVVVWRLRLIVISNYAVQLTQKISHAA